MSTEAIIGNIAQYIIYVGLFYVILISLKVSEKRVLRSLVLAATLKLADLIGSLTISFLLVSFEKVPFIGVVLSTCLVVLVFYLIVRNLLKLQTWQYIVIPIGVSFVGNILLSVVAVFYYKAVA